MDRIEKTVLLRAPLARVWAAISDSRRFGDWFGARFDGPFVAGQPVTGVIAMTKVDPEVAKLQEKAAGMPFTLAVEAVEPMRRLAFRWHPFAIDPHTDYSAEPMTLVTLALAEEAGGVRLTITETGFDALPAERRAAALQANEGGWSHQARLIEKYLAGPREPGS
jgi:uncharacterized protein YndB with AHSA1/START domain